MVRLKNRLTDFQLPLDARNTTMVQNHWKLTGTDRNLLIRELTKVREDMIFMVQEKYGFTERRY